MDVKFLKSAFRPSHYPPPDRSEIAFAGRSNVGKSSLINTLVNRRNIARTGSRPGRTQSINFFDLQDRLRLVDLPGYGFARVPAHVQAAWRPMVETYLRERKNLRGVVVILDVRRDPAEGDIDLLTWLKTYGIPPVVVLTKIDKLSRSKRSARAAAVTRALSGIMEREPVLFSARTREGLHEVWRRIEEVLDASDTEGS